MGKIIVQDLAHRLAQEYPNYGENETKYSSSSNHQDAMGKRLAFRGDCGFCDLDHHAFTSFIDLSHLKLLGNQFEDSFVILNVAISPHILQTCLGYFPGRDHRVSIRRRVVADHLCQLFLQGGQLLLGLDNLVLKDFASGNF